MSEEILNPEGLLTKGLGSGFAGEITPTKTDRVGVFQLKQSLLQTEKGDLYVDQWTPGRLGGGQELAKTRDGKMITRLYAGGTVNLDSLARLGVTHDEVMNYLTGKVRELGEKTRLLEPCHPPKDGKFQYRYEIIRKLEEIPVSVTEEFIAYDDKDIFVHYFLICPVE